MGVYSNKKMVEHLIRFFVRNYLKPELPYGKPQIMSRLIDFQEKEGAKFSYGSLFKLLHEELVRLKDDSQFIEYLLQIFAFIKPQAMKEKKKHVERIFQELRSQPFPYYRLLLLSARENDHYPILKQGMQKIIAYPQPLMGFEFID